MKNLLKETITRKLPTPAIRKQIVLTILATVFVLIVFYSFTSVSYYYSSTNHFCSTKCHEMVQPYQEYLLSSHYDSRKGVVADCADCHLPPGLIEKWYVKTKQGVNDSLVHIFGDPENLDHVALKISARKNIHPGSCMKCHKNLFPSDLPRGGFKAHKAFKNQEASNCVDCHVNLVHVSPS
ncbi:MAG: NapC/NirT family cytochrome c [Nitrospinota bacterium]|jgi:cytochrome c nitrite reductase small subunit|nr:NapC/NirT family cytochrome c [Nitrospinota bacterium]MDP7580409.1 NapC/NirT family cytochrome c [Nitrospinota bacterium]HJN01480.1 NapC/NirT family cytochrome c [Nitrospinota bacterium]|tara:strand:+ start:366 stop:908 length:543 start_codon:yes stop_codon:yes gene_type:complete